MAEQRQEDLEDTVSSASQSKFFKLSSHNLVPTLAMQN